jgi:PilZ domain
MGAVPVSEKREAQEPEIGPSEGARSTPSKRCEDGREAPGGEVLGGEDGPERGRRHSPRLNVEDEAEIVLVRSGSALRGRILDLSVTGCCIRTEQQFPVGIYTRVETSFRLEGLPFRLDGVIQSVHDRNTVGIRFLDVSERKRQLILELISELVAMGPGRVAVASKEGARAATSEEKTA